jgi:hypothetical protein
MMPINMEAILDSSILLLTYNRFFFISAIYFKSNYQNYVDDADQRRGYIRLFYIALNI